MAKRHIWEVDEGWSQKSFGTMDNLAVWKFDIPDGTKGAPGKLGRPGHQGHET
jgi:hypothetical protein